jgi:hypothetical protein
MLPQSRGGGAHGNLVKACKPCNGDKGSLTLEEYRLVIALRRGLVQEISMRFAGEESGWTDVRVPESATHNRGQ